MKLKDQIESIIKETPQGIEESGCTCSNCSETRTKIVQSISTLFERMAKEVIGKGKLQFLTHDNFEYQNGWCDGRDKLREEQKETLKQLIEGDEE